MKKIIMSLSLVLTVGFTNAFAGSDPDPDQKVLDGFRKEFPSAHTVSWSTQAEYEKAVFVLAGRRVVAYFNKEGSLEGTMRYIFYDQLPLTVMTGVDRRFEDAVVLDIREINNSEGTHYRIRLESGSKNYRIRVSADGGISEVEKIK